MLPHINVGVENNCLAWGHGAYPLSVGVVVDHKIILLKLRSGPKVCNSLLVKPEFPQAIGAVHIGRNDTGISVGSQCAHRTISTPTTHKSSIRGRLGQAEAGSQVSLGDPALEVVLNSFVAKSVLARCPQNSLPT